MMLDATQKFDQASTAERLFGWHASLFPTGRTGIDRITLGVWRTAASIAMRVVSGRIDNETVHFEAPEAHRLASEMDQFLHWFNLSSTVDPVLKAALAHFWFVTIHPFEDGNGRIARAIADLLLARAGRTKDRFYSVSTQIEVERNVYYARLETAAWVSGLPLPCDRCCRYGAG